VEELDAEAAKDLITFAYFNDTQPLEHTKRRKRHVDSSDEEDEDEDGGDGDGGDGDAARKKSTTRSVRAFDLSWRRP
jgi:hypothetical protein